MTRIQAFATLPVYLLILTWPLQSHAIGLQTGTWEINMHASNPVNGQPIERTATECITDGDFDPAEAMMQAGMCRVIDRRESGNSVSWKMECGGSDMPLFNGEGTFISHGDHAEGEMKIIMTMGENTMEVSNNWTGRRISATCTGQ